MAIEAVLIAMEGISPIHLAIPCTLFGDDHGDGRPFNLTLCAEKPGPLTTTVGLEIKVTRGLDALDTADIVIVPSWPEPSSRPSQDLIDALARAADRGSALLGLCLGAYVLGYAGLLNGREATTHWRYAEDFGARFPLVRVSPRKLYVQSGAIWTSAGVAAGFDCCLEFVSRQCGTKTANAMARNIVVAPHRPGGQAQFITAPRPRTTADERLNAVIADIRNTLERSHSIDAIAARLCMSRRTFTRRFSDTVGLPFGEWLIAERVQFARELLETGDRSIDQVALAAGFGSTAAFRLQFAQRVGLSPAQWRRAFKGGARR